MATQKDDRESCSEKKCETSPDAPFNQVERPLGNAANQHPAKDYQEEIEKQKQYFKGGTKP